MVHSLIVYNWNHYVWVCVVQCVVTFPLRFPHLCLFRWPMLEMVRALFPSNSNTKTRPTCKDIQIFPPCTIIVLWVSVTLNLIRSTTCSSHVYAASQLNMDWFLLDTPQIIFNLKKDYSWSINLHFHHRRHRNNM